MATYEIPIEGRDEWLAAARRLAWQSGGGSGAPRTARSPSWPPGAARVDRRADRDDTREASHTFRRHQSEGRLPARHAAAHADTPL